MGLGSKTPFAYEGCNEFTVRSRVDGIETLYLVSKPANGIPGLLPVSSKKTKERNGFKVSMEIKRDDFWEFEYKAQKVFRPFKIKPKFIDKEATIDTYGDVNMAGDNWKKYSGAYGTQVTVVQGNIEYSVKLDMFGSSSTKSLIDNRGHYVIEYPLGTVQFSPDRETLNYTKNTLAVLRATFLEINETYKQAVYDVLNDVETQYDLLTNIENSYFEIHEFMKHAKTFNIQFNNAVIDYTTFYVNIPCKFGTPDASFKAEMFSDGMLKTKSRSKQSYNDTAKQYEVSWATVMPETTKTVFVFIDTNRSRIRMKLDKLASTGIKKEHMVIISGNVSEAKDIMIEHGYPAKNMYNISDLTYDKPLKTVDHSIYFKLNVYSEWKRTSNLSLNDDLDTLYIVLFRGNPIAATKTKNGWEYDKHHATYSSINIGKQVMQKLGIKYNLVGIGLNDLKKIDGEFLQFFEYTEPLISQFIEENKVDYDQVTLQNYVHTHRHDIINFHSLFKDIKCIATLEEYVKASDIVTRLNAPTTVDYTQRRLLQELRFLTQDQPSLNDIALIEDVDTDKFYGKYPMLELLDFDSLVLNDSTLDEIENYIKLIDK